MYNLLMVIKILCSLQLLTDWAITTVMMRAMVVMSFVNFITSTDFVLYCHFVELFVCKFQPKVGQRVWPKSKISHITP
jgi:hypothetical protein